MFSEVFVTHKKFDIKAHSPFFYYRSPILLYHKKTKTAISLYQNCVFCNDLNYTPSRCKCTSCPWGFAPCSASCAKRRRLVDRATAGATVARLACASTDSLVLGYLRLADRFAAARRGGQISLSPRNSKKTVTRKGNGAN